MNWTEISELDPIWLNLGGGGDCHPKPNYRNFVSVDLGAVGDWSVQHDVTRPLPLPDGSVERIVSEHFLEHLPSERIAGVLDECFRLLQPGGFLRIAVPDYRNPRLRKHLERGFDRHHSDHLTLPTYTVMRDLAERSRFNGYMFYHYWEANTFVERPIDYSLGYVKRTPDNDARCKKTGLSTTLAGYLRMTGYLISRGVKADRTELLLQKNNRIRKTSLVADLHKD